jgi:hypothetical protein
MPSDWINADQALRLVSESCHPMLARKSICTRANAGLIRARARRVIMGSEQADECDVPTKFWWARGEAALEQNWATGDFETWIDGGTHCLAFGVEFLRTDIVAMVPSKLHGKTLSEWQAGNFEPAGRCLEELKASLGLTTAEASSALLKHCRAGLVRSRCKEIWSRLRTRYGDQEPDVEHDVEVPEWAWSSVSGPDAILNWPASAFAGEDLIDGDEVKVKLTGVELEVGGVIELERYIQSLRSDAEGAPPKEPEAPASVGKGGRRPSEKWPDWVAELVAVVHDEGIPGGVGSQGQEKLLERIANALAERGLEGPARTTVQPVVQAVLDRLRAGN